MTEMASSSAISPEDTAFETSGVTRDAVFLRDKRIVEALLFASERPLADEDFRFHLGKEAQLDVILAELADRKSTRLNSSHVSESRMPSSA